MPESDPENATPSHFADRVAALEQELAAARSHQRVTEEAFHELRQLVERAQSYAVSGGELIRQLEGERRRVARELHDGMSQQIVLMEFGLARLGSASSPEERAEVRALREQLGFLAQEIRRVAHGLHPLILEDLGLEAALARLVRDFQCTWPAPVRLAIEALPEVLPIEVSATLYRIAQECLSNITKHAERAPVRVTLRGGSGRLELSVEDAGPGFEPTAVPAGAGLGLTSIRERARLVWGAIEVTSRPGRGTEIRAIVPLADAAPDMLAYGQADARDARGDDDGEAAQG